MVALLLFVIFALGVASIMDGQLKQLSDDDIDDCLQLGLCIFIPGILQSAFRFCAHYSNRADPTSGPQSLRTTSSIHLYHPQNDAAGCVMLYSTRHRSRLPSLSAEMAGSPFQIALFVRLWQLKPRRLRSSSVSKRVSSRLPPAGPDSIKLFTPRSRCSHIISHFFRLSCAGVHISVVNVASNRPVSESFFDDVFGDDDILDPNTDRFE